MIVSHRPYPERQDITFRQLASGLAGSVPGGAIDFVGITGATLLEAPRVTLDAYRALSLSTSMGPLTKTLVGALIPVGVGVGIGVTAAGALGYGAIKGAVDATQHNLGESVRNRL